MGRYTVGLPVNTVGQWEEAPVYPKGLRTSPLLCLPMQSISGLLGKSGDGVNSH